MSEEKSSNLPERKNDFVGQLINKKFNNLPEDTQNALAEFAAKKKLEIEVKSTEDYLTNENARINIDNHIKTAETLSRYRSTKGIDKVTSNIKTASGTMNIESKSGYCYVATATYQNSNHYNVVILRDFRDRYLVNNIFGRFFIKIYYLIGKDLAFFPEHFVCIRKLSKNIIDKLVEKIVHKYYL